MEKTNIHAEIARKTVKNKNYKGSLLTQSLIYKASIMYTVVTGAQIDIHL